MELEVEKLGSFGLGSCFWYLILSVLSSIKDLIDIHCEANN